MQTGCWVLLIAVIQASLAYGVTYHVDATDGNDAWSGRLAAPNVDKSDGPFATLTRARDEIRSWRIAGEDKGPATVWIRGGVYAFTETFRLDARDCGTAGSPVVFRAFANERPVLIGGRPITGFVPHKGEILKADVGAQGFKGIYFRQLLFAGQRQHLARYPNSDPANPYGGGWAYADGKIVNMYSEVPGEDRHSFIYRPEDARPWARPDEVEVFVFPRYNWWNNICPIKSVDRETRQITLAKDASYAIRPGDRYYLQNALEELDAPGEWYLDRQTWTLYFWPPAPLTSGPVYAPLRRTVIQLDKVSHVTLRGLIVECAEGAGMVLNECTDCRVAGCTIRNVGDYNGCGVAVNGGTDNGIVGCDISHTGSHGVTISGGDRKTLTAANNLADNNYIHHVGVYYKQGVGINLNGVGNRVSHNLIHDGPRMGILFSGNNLVIEYNHIRHVNLETEDTGAVYTGGRDWISSRGTVIRYNYFHDILGYGRDGQGRWVSPHFAWGVYLDDNAGGVDVIGNVVVRAPRAGLHLHNGRDNRIENNVFVDSSLQQIEYSGWTDQHPYWRSHLPTMIQGYEMVADQPAWRSMRNMDLHPTKAVLPDGTIMSGNEFVRNIIAYRDPQAKLFRFNNVSLDHNRWDWNLVWHYGLPLITGQKKGVEATDEWAAWQAKGQDTRSLVADPLFVDADRDDYRLRPDSPAFKLGFKPIPMDEIGPYAHELRATWPIVEAEGALEKPLVSR